MKKMNKKGFTLIELLAIIVILAIIAVITVPLILGIIDEARSKAAKSSVVGYGKAVELAYSHYLLGTSEDATLTLADSAEELSAKLSAGSYIKLQKSATAADDINLRVDFSGDKVVCSTTADNNKAADGKLTLVACQINGTGDTYVYDNGRACKTSEATNNVCPAS